MSGEDVAKRACRRAIGRSISPASEIFSRMMMLHAGGLKIIEHDDYNGVANEAL